MTNPNLLREHAEQQFAAELAHLAELDDRQRPPNWNLSPWAVETYLLGGQNLTMDEFTGRVCRLAGVRPPLRLPYAVASGANRALALTARLGGPAPAVPDDLLRASRLYTFVTSAQAQRELGYTIRPFEDSVRDTLRWYLGRGELRATTPELQALAAEAAPAA